ncbi:MAG: glycosyltransferase family 4 protein [Gammaproteobacteria bacterium]|nr:glycosyltransferase family 4 protein [Gammaproteobacteria bacterium]
MLVHYRRLSLATHPWHSQLTEGYHYRVYQEQTGVDWRLIRLALMSEKHLASQSFVVAGWNHPTAWLLLTLLALRRGNFVIWTDTPNLARIRSGWFQKARRVFLRWVFGRARYIMGTGMPALRALEIMGASSAKLVNYPYWIDLNMYKTIRVIRSTPGSPLVFLSSGRIQNDLKGHDIAIQALAVVARRDLVSFEYRIAGAGPDTDALLALAKTLGIGERVKLLGWLEPGELIEQMRMADIFIHPSSVHEPYGVAVIEAMTVGLPVLASDVTCAALDRVKPGVNGYIHRAGDINQLAEHIIDLATDRGRIAIMSDHAQLTAMQWPLSKGVISIKMLLCNSK